MECSGRVEEKVEDGEEDEELEEMAQEINAIIESPTVKRGKNYMIPNHLLIMRVILSVCMFVTCYSEITVGRISVVDGSFDR